jgi:hypothetical protein
VETADDENGSAGKFTTGSNTLKLTDPLSIVRKVVTVTNVPRSGTFTTRIVDPVKSRTWPVFVF